MNNRYLIRHRWKQSHQMCANHEASVIIMDEKMLFLTWNPALRWHCCFWSACTGLWDIKYFCQFYFLFGVLSSLAICVYFACVYCLQYYCSLAIIPLLFAYEAVIAGHDNLFLLPSYSTSFLPGFLKGGWKWDSGFLWCCSDRSRRVIDR